MNDEIQLILTTVEDDMNNALTHLESELAKVRAGRANPTMLDSIYVDYYGTKTPLNQVATINSPDPRALAIQPFEKSLLVVIEKAIQAANLGFNPQNDGVMIRIIVPPLTEDRRKDLVKKAKNEGEQAKVVIRNARKEGNEEVKKLVKNGLPEDEGKVVEDKVQKLTDAHITKVDKLREVKEKEILTV
jgi:ribosome recycling factor